MPLPLHHRVRLRPRADTLYVTRNRTALATDADGFITGGVERGLFVRQTRLLSRYRYRINGQPWHPIALSNLDQHTWMGYYLACSPEAGDDPRFETLGPGGTLAQQPIELRLTRQVGDGLGEEVDVTNFTRREVAFDLALEVDADFADQLETKHRRHQFGERTREWRGEPDGDWVLMYRYEAENAFDEQGERDVARFDAGLALRIELTDTSPRFDEHESVITFPLRLPPGGTWHARIECLASFDGQELTLLGGDGPAGEADRRRTLFLRESTQFATRESGSLAPAVFSTLEQARLDLAALRLDDLDRGERAWVPAAGLPVYLALFGRDTLTASWQAALVSTDLMRGTLPEIARWQGRRTDDWRDEQPGKMLHQADTGPLAALNLNPLGRYYGSITTSAFYPVVVSELWHWTGDRELVRPFVAPALEALRWLDAEARALGRGFYAYETRSRSGVRHQAWKDSSDAIVDADGAQVEPPIATCEEQGFVYLAKLHLSELLWWLDDKREAKRLHQEAGELRARFNEAFWMEGAGYFALGLDRDGRQIESITSNPGHCLATGIADPARVSATADRLFQPDLFSGWGVRTLSSRNPAFNPYSYHLGSVWPVEQATFALGFARYGLHDHVERITRAQFEAAAQFDAYRLPELFSGHARDAPHPFPSLYPGANSPQAWSSSAVFVLLQSLLGLYPYAPLKLLLVDPHLPEWLPEITLRNLHVGAATVDIRFFRTDSGAGDYRVLDQRGALHVVRQPSPWSLTASRTERLVDALRSLMPGR